MMRNNYRKYLVLAIIGSIIIGLAFYLLLNNYLDKKEIVVTSRNIEAGKKINEEDLDFKEYYKNSLPENYVEDKESVIGKIINVERRKGDYISIDMFDKKTQESIFGRLAEGDVVIAINVQYEEPLLEEVRTGNCISIVSTEYEKELLYPDYIQFSESSNNKYSNQTDGSYHIGGIKDKSINFFSAGDYIDSTMFNLSENIILINGQVMVRNLEVICIEKNISDINKNILLNNSNHITSIYLKCDIKEAPIVARLTKDNNYKIVIEEV